MVEIFRGEIWLVNVDPAIGAEINKTRPAIIVSNNINNLYSSTVTVVPISDKGAKVYPVEVLLSSKNIGLNKSSKAKCQQIRTVDKKRLMKKLGAISEEEKEELKNAIEIHLGIDS